MAVGGPPDTLSARHRHLAVLVAAGRTNTEIAELLDYSPTRISIIRGSPLFKALVAEVQADFRQQMITTVVERLNGEADKTLDTLVELRDTAGGALTGTVPDPKIRLGAANSLADRIPDLARKSKVEDVKELRLVLSRSDLAEMMQARREASGGRGERPRPIEAVAESAAAPIPARSIDEVIADLAGRDE